MIRIRNEADFASWFKKNYKKLGFSSIAKDNKGKFPDFTMNEGDRKVRVELEIKSSNFLLHQHSISKVDRVICIKKDVELNVPITELKNFKIIAYNKESPYSLESQVYRLFNKKRLLITSDIMKALNITHATAQRNLIELFIQGKIDRLKKEGITLWMIK